VNVGSGHEIVIADLVELIARKTGFKARSASTRPARRPTAPLPGHDEGQTTVRLHRDNLAEQGIEQTIAWYCQASAKRLAG